jgi:hypothetical protein
VGPTRFVLCALRGVLVQRTDLKNVSFSVFVCCPGGKDGMKKLREYKASRQLPQLAATPTTAHKGTHIEAGCG